MILSYHSAALDEAVGAAEWYAVESDQFLADSFYEELDAALRLISRHPEIGMRQTRNTRAFRLARFPYTVIYSVQTELVRILAIAHQSRRPGYWTSRR